MADRIHANTEWLDKCARDLSSIERSINGVAGQLAGIKLRKDEGGNLKVSLSCGLRMTGTGFSGSNATDDIRQLQRAAAALTGATAVFSSGVSQAARLFENAENRAVATLRGLSTAHQTDVYEGNGDLPGADLNSGKYSDKTGTGGKDSSSQKATMNPLEFLGSLVGKKGTVASGKIEGRSKIGPIDISGSLEGEGPGYSIERIGKGKLSSKDGKYSLGFEDGLKGEVHLFQGKGVLDVGPAHGEVSGGVRRVAVTGTVGTTLFKDGKFSPTIQGKLKGEGSVLDGKIGYRIGSEDYNYHTSADGSLITAEGEISVGAGKIKWTDKKGVEHQGYGVQGKIGGEAYLAKGKVTGGYTIMGIKIDVGVSGGVGGGGASIGGQVTADGASGTIGGGVLVGGDLDVSIDWSNFKIPKLPKLPKGLDPRSLLA